MSSEPDASDTPAERAWDAWYEEPHWPGWPDGEVPEYPEVERLAFMAGYEAGRSEDGPQARVCLTHRRINICRQGEREGGCVWSSEPADLTEAFAHEKDPA